MFKAENAAGGSVKAGMYSKVQRCMAPVRCLHAFGNSSGYHTTGIVRLLLRVVQNYRKADRSHVADELVSGPAGWSTEVDQPRRELETYGSGMEASASSGKQYSSNGLGFFGLGFCWRGSSRQRLPPGGGAGARATWSSTLTNASPFSLM